VRRNIRLIGGRIPAAFYQAAKCFKPAAAQREEIDAKDRFAPRSLRSAGAGTAMRTLHGVL
jgi:hypothetical protein